MKNKNIIPIAILFFVLIMLGIMCIYLNINIMPDKKTKPSFYFSLDDNNGQIMISAFEGDNGNIYVFLPSYAEMDKLKLRTDTDIYIDGNKVEDGSVCSEYEIGTEYSLIASADDGKTIQFIKSANVATMYINTISGSMDRVYKNKEYEESVSVKLVNADGTINYMGSNDSINGRGNSSWTLDEKKPFTLKLSDKANLLYMGENEKWNLISNAFDKTNIRNKMVYDFSKSIGMLSPNSEFVDLYLNGEYNGLYLLTEKVQIESNFMQQAEQNMSCLFLRDSYYDKYDNKFITDANQPVCISQPKVCSQSEINELKQRVQSMENAILSEEGRDNITGKTWQDLIDTDSWVKKHLIEEVFANIEMGFKSQYFYCVNDDDKIYAGPVWDYDLILGGYYTDNNPNRFTNRQYMQNTQFNDYTCWFTELYKKPEFYKKLSDTYKKEVVSKLEELYNTQIDVLANRVDEASNMDCLRWQKDYIYAVSVKDLKEYFRDHVGFLSSVWVDNIKYHTIAFESFIDHKSYQYYTVEDGEIFIDMPSNKELGVDDELLWYNKETGKVFNPELPVYEDMVLCVKSSVEQDETSNISTPFMLELRGYIKYVIIAFFVVSFFLIFAVIIIIDKKHIRK